MSGYVYTGTMTLTPEDGVLQYPMANVRCQITYTPGSGDANLPTKIPVSINLTGSLTADQTYFTGKTATLDLTEDSIQPGVYTAEFYGYISARRLGPDSYVAGAAGYTASISGMANPSTVEWDTAVAPPFIYYSWDQICVPINDDDDMTPADDGVNALMLKIVILTEPGGSPVQDYIIRWYGKYNADLFAPGPDQLLMARPFVGKSTTVAKPAYSYFVGGGNTPTVMIVSDNTGEANLTIIPTTQPMCLGLEVFTMAGGDGVKDMPDFGVYDPYPLAQELSPPDVKLTPVDGNTYYDLDSSPTPYVPVDLLFGKLATGTYDVYVFNNVDQRKSPVSNEVYISDGSQQSKSLTVSIFKAFFESVSESDSDADPNDSGYNSLFFILNNSISGCLTSGLNRAQYVGETAAFEPDKTIQPRDLSNPVVPNADQTINLNTTRLGLTVVVKVAAGGEWDKPAPGDTVWVTVYVSGWQPPSQKETGNVLQIPAILADTDISTGSISVTFASSDVNGYGADPNNSQQFGACYVEYYVVQKGEDSADMSNRIYSEYSSYRLNTVA